MLPPRASFNATWFIEQNLVPLLDAFFRNGPDPTQRKFVVHIDIENASAPNARVTQNFFEHNPLKRLPHPPYSPDISPSDFSFYLFRKVKNALIGREISDEIDLLEVVTEILSGIWRDEFHAIFRSWVRLSVCRP
jgi:histone-lysine N-methyltransferase SETMAR